MKKQITLLITVLLTACMFSYAQTSVKGTVADSKNAPIPGATIKVKETGKAGATDINGNFAIQAAGNSTLVVSSVGYTTIEIKVNNRTTVNVTLEDDSKQLSDVVVIGYGTRAVKDVTGAISSVKAERLENENPASVSDLIRGNVPGIQVAMNTSPKGGSSDDLTLRGKVSLTGNTAPLIVLDGVIFPGQLADINVDDIERVDVLRDPSALAVYGAQSGAGVVAITTKKGKSGAPTITLNANFGIAELEKNQKFYQGTDFLNWRADGARSSNTANPYYYYSNPNALPDGVTLTQFLSGQTGDPTTIWLQRLGLFPNEITNYQNGNVTNWSNLIFRKGFRQDYTASLSGKNETVTYYMSGNFTKNQNLIQGGEYKDGRFRVNLEGKASKFLTIGMNAQFASRDESNSSNPFGVNSYDLHQADWTQIINASPYGDFYNSDGSIRRIDTDDSGLNYRNPFAGNIYNQNVNVNNVIFASLFARLDLPFGIKYSFTYAPQIEAYRAFFFRPVANPNELTGGTAYRSMENRYRYNMDNLLTWNKTFGIHNIDVTALLNREKFQSWYTRTNNQQLTPSDALGYDNIGAGTLPVESSDDNTYTGDGLMGRIQYTLLGRYNIYGTIRRDGFSPFGLKFPRATYPSAAFGWTFSEEKFMKNIKWLDFGKLRVSYGANGNRPGTGTPNPAIALALLATPKYPTVNSGTLVNNSVLYVSTLQNENLKWERVTGTNIGLDFTVLHNRLSGSIDVYNRKTTDMLVSRSISTIQGYDYVNIMPGGANNSSVLTNLGEVNNKGIELSLDAKIYKSKNFNWSASGTFFVNRNKIVHLYPPAAVVDASGNTTYVEKDDIGNGWFIGHDINAVWDYKILGTWKTSEATDAAKYGAKPGDFKLEDVNGDGKYDNNDKQFLGTKTARYSWSLRNDINFLHNFDFSVLLVSNVGSLRQYNQALNNPGSVGFVRMNSYVQPYWTADNQIDDYARLNSGQSGTTINVWRSSSFVRVQTVSLGYNFDKKLIQPIGLKSAKLFVNVANLAVMSPWQFWDPQNDGPTPRYISAGINVTL